MPDTDTTTDTVATDTTDTTVIPTETNDDIANEIIAAAEDLSLAVNSPEALARMLRDYIARNMSSRVQVGYWVTVNKERKTDKGITVVVRKLPLGLTLRGLLGGWSAGFGIYSKPFTVNDKSHAVSISIGAGAVGDLHFDRLYPVVGVSIKF